MSYHRVLPPPPALANSSAAAPWGTEPDPIPQHKIMTEENSSAIPTRTKSVTISQKSPSPQPEKAPPSPEAESSDEYPNSPKIPTRSSSRNSSGEKVGLGIRLPSISWQGEPPSQICLCQPDPKIPRPRNAFILYRQHHQSSVVAANPGLANPEISKVIGDHWRTSPQEIKGHWKLLAEEEKLRHQKQYPDYRYQPRRNGRNNSQSNSLASASSPNDGENRRCAKCGGRSITTPSMMSTPIFSAGPNTAPSTPYSPNRPMPTPSTGSATRRFPHGVDSPSLNASPGGSRPRSNAPSNNIAALQLSSPRFKRQEQSDFPLSPEIKRRRVANAYNAVAPPNGQLTPFPFPQGRRRDSLPRPEFMPSQSGNGGFTMGPPPRPHHGHPDSSLTLAPLQTSTKPDSATSTQAKSVEAMVMSIPTINKIRLLSKISPPLPQPGPASPPRSVRGFVIAIDGSDSACVAQITEALLTSLSGHHPIRVFETPSHPFTAKPAWKSDESADTFQNYLYIVEQYHSLSAEIISYITTYPPQSSSPSASPTPISPKTMPPLKPFTRSSSQKITDTPSSEPPPGVPIALVPSFQLTHADVFASRIPITDAYAPVDHWQWMATLWRGTVGPDVTVVVVPPPQLPLQLPHPHTTPPNSTEMSKPNSTGKAKAVSANGGGPGVEVRLEDSGAIMVRVDGKGVGEGSLRRVGFEVGEWVRGRDEGRRGS